MMSGLHSRALAQFVLAMGTVMGGCSSSPPPILVTLTPSAPQSIDQSQTVAITAILMNDRTDKGVLWALTGPGSLS
ncbi:MAG: hypothetical protein ABSG16_15560, partial [Candidatus Acidiferrum sp.]